MGRTVVAAGEFGAASTSQAVGGYSRGLPTERARAPRSAIPSANGCVASITSEPRGRLGMTAVRSLRRTRRCAPPRLAAGAGDPTSQGRRTTSTPSDTSREANSRASAVPPSSRTFTAHQAAGGGGRQASQPPRVSATPRRPGSPRPDLQEGPAGLAQRCEADRGRRSRYPGRPGDLRQEPLSELVASRQPCHIVPNTAPAPRAAHELLSIPRPASPGRGGSRTRSPARPTPSRWTGRAPSPARTPFAHPAGRDRPPRSRRDPRPVRVRDRPAEHLVPAADAEHGPPRRDVAMDRGVEPARAQPRQICDRGPGTGDDQQVRVRDVTGAAGEHHVDVWLRPERVDIGEVADPRQPQHRDLQARLRARGPSPVQVEGVLGIQPEVRAARAARRRTAGRSAARSAETRLQEARSPRNLFTTNPAISAWSSRSSSAIVPYSDANTPPRSMSPTTMSAVRRGAPAPC